MATANKQKVLNKKNLEKAFKLIDKVSLEFIHVKLSLRLG